MVKARIATFGIEDLGAFWEKPFSICHFYLSYKNLNERSSSRSLLSHIFHN